MGSLNVARHFARKKYIQELLMSDVAREKLYMKCWGLKEKIHLKFISDKITPHQEVEEVLSGRCARYRSALTVTQRRIAKMSDDLFRITRSMEKTLAILQEQRALVERSKLLRS